MMRTQLAIGLFCLFLLSGCAYLKDRGKDALEILELSGGFALGVEANLRVTKPLQVGFGAYSGHWAGLNEGFFTTWKEDRAEMGIPFLYYHEIQRSGENLVGIRHPLPGEPGYEEYLNDMFLINDRGFFEVGATANVVCLGLDVGLETAELFDFLAGICFWDPLKDDCYARDLDALILQVQSHSPDRRAAAARALRRRTGENFDYTITTSRGDHTRDQLDAWRRWKLWREEKKGEKKGTDN
jgi:hypothetical protein